MGDPYKVVIVGPLAPLATGFHTYLTRLGYSPDSTSNQLQLIAHLSRWMDVQGLSVQELSDHVINAFFAERRLHYHNFHTSRALVFSSRIWKHVRGETVAEMRGSDSTKTMAPTRMVPKSLVPGSYEQKAGGFLT